MFGTVTESLLRRPIYHEETLLDQAWKAIRL